MASTVSKLFRILIFIGILAGLFFLGRWMWHDWRGFGAFLIPWWKVTLAKPVMALLIRAFDLAGGDLLGFLFIVSIASWLVAKAFGTVTSWGVANAARQRASVERSVASVEDVQARLRSMFADDVEAMAFYESRLGTAMPGRRGGRTKSAARAQILGCGGCLFTLLWTVVSVPVAILVNLAIFDGMMKLFLGRPGQMIMIGSHPLPARYLGFALQERSIVLTLLTGFVGILAWLVANFPVTGRTLPRPNPRWLWLTLLPAAILMYIVLNGFLLLWTLVTAIVLLVNALWRQVWKGLFLRMRAAIALWRTRREPSGGDDAGQTAIVFTLD